MCLCDTVPPFILVVRWVLPFHPETDMSQWGGQVEVKTCSPWWVRT